MSTKSTGPRSFADFLRDDCDDDEDNVAYADPAALAFTAQSHRDAAQRTVAPAVEQRRDLKADEQRTYEFHRSQAALFDSAVGVAEQRCKKILDSRAQVGGVSSRTVGGGTWQVGAGQGIYARGDQRTSWLADMVAANLRGDPDAHDRLRRNNQEVAIEQRAQSTTDGAGGDFVPPLWMVQSYIALARARRATADLLHREPLPSGTDSLNVPKVLTGTATAAQTTQNTVIQNTDATTGFSTGAVQTIAGGQTLSVQQIEQSPINLDEVYLKDLLADLAAKIDVLVLNNSTANALGLLQVAGTNAVTFTSASPTLALLYPKLADARQRIEVSRFDSPTAIVMNPRRWAFMLAAVDSGNRPMVVPNSGGPYNAAAVSNGNASLSGYVGDSLGLPVYLDPLVPTNLGAGTNEDRIIVAKFDDSWLYESTPRAEMFREPKADQMSVYLRVYQYAAIVHRYPGAISIVAGTGLTTPVF